MRKNKIQKGLLLGLLLLCQASFAQGTGENKGEAQSREYYVEVLTKIADPVLSALSKQELKATMPVEKTKDAYGGREQVTYLEAFGRLLAGIGPWLELGPDDTPEGQLRKKYILLAQQSIHNATDPESADFMNFTENGQPLVDAAFFAQGLLRAPTQLWEPLSPETKANVIAALKSSRVISPFYSNWLLFTGMVEAALLKFDGEADMVRLAYPINKHKEWYLGDGMYGDGPEFHWDYYNSFVIQPMLLDITKVLKEKDLGMGRDFDLFLERAQRYAAIQERLISPEGTYPIIGRSMAYRFGAFQCLSQIALWQELPDKVKPAQVRGALASVIRRHMEAEDMFDDQGWLTLGFYGHQPEVAEPYISTGSLYLCAEVFLVLGLPANAPFWADPAVDWTQKRIWSGGDATRDHAER
ncbi:DUF2264 domain-containing protein [Echinicola sp. CAU 1574]|uniref:DUF2264 domain-containing protein n=1 Tax=Echinicola arenosa TaxID=2774144 RepID=A0ABR9AHI4_9BACT|nr:DUF2264 domain-containing protein [Echinicola arenosa]MBD8488170.1 DUF2264 domain-containing protein [Echinicola arenosa]